MTDTLTALNVAILVTDGFEQTEMTGPLQALEQADVTVKIIGEHRGPVLGKHHKQPGDRFDAQMAIADADPMEFDAVLLPGGDENGYRIRTLPEARHFVQQMDEMGKTIAAICHGTLVLAEAGLLEGRTLTSYPGIQDDMRRAGGNWVDREVVVDGNLITSRKPEDVPAFSQCLIDALRQRLQSSVRGTRDEHPEIGAQG